MSLSKKILVVDDDIVCVSLLAILLRQHGFEVVEALSGEEAKEVLNASFDAVVTDMHMGPERMNGNDVAELAQKMGIKVILLFFSLKSITPKENLFSDIFYKPQNAIVIVQALLSLH